ncbi:MAG TPA: SpvB/TcaC N-terminal domain-containing protein, partial [Spirochaetota bacterium]|nr:SpvB/TcaC N-terminal domain-containing protein [Spirochaetota bacterium]
MRTASEKSKITACGTARAFLAALVLAASILAGCTGGRSGGAVSAAAGAGIIQEGLPVKIVPTSVAVVYPESGIILNQGSDVEMAWRLFDGNTDTLFTAAAPARVRFYIRKGYTVRRIKMFGPVRYGVKAYMGSGASRENAPWFKPEPGKGGSGWTGFTAASPAAADYIDFDITPGDDDGCGIPEIEIWGEHDGGVAYGAVAASLRAAASADELDRAAEGGPGHVFIFNAQPDDISFSANDRDNPARFIITQNLRPTSIKRAYLRYSAKNVYRPVGIEHRVNGMDWFGGLDVPVPESDTAEWREQSEEINPQWLAPGDNSVDFCSPKSDVAIRSLRLVVEIDEGWDFAESCSIAEAADGDVSTGAALKEGPEGMEIAFERTIEPDTVLINMPGPQAGALSLYYLRDNAWREAVPGWRLDTSKLKAGWNIIALPVSLPADAVRLSLDPAGTGSPVTINELRIGASPVGGGLSNARVVVSYPRAGEFFGRTAYVQGFTVPARNSAGMLSLSAGADPMGAVNAGSPFAISFTKDDAGFGGQGDDEAWDPVIIASDALYYGARVVQLDNNLLSSSAGSGGSSGGGSSGGGSGDGGSVSGTGGYSADVYPDSSKTITCGSLTITVPKGAVSEKVTITVIPLGRNDIAALNEGMVNVTSPDAGYRFLVNGRPHYQFKTPIQISFTYGTALLPQGQGDGDVAMFYHDEAAKIWKRLQRVKTPVPVTGPSPGTSQSVISAVGAVMTDSAHGLVTSETDHFTDIINATLTVPEHPDPLAYNPNSIKDIKAADPSAGINLIEAPEANSNGDAVLSYPIELPRGRGGLQPQLAIRYNSSGGNSWLGQGWDLPVPSVTIDTKFGVPRYSNDETYLLEGAELVETAPGSGVFRQRVEGQFKRIRRMGSAYNNYWWEVTDKSGTVFVYGQTDQARLSGNALLKPGAIFTWFLERVTDRNGNTMSYEYERVTYQPPGSLETFTQLYLSRITYSGSYTVEFALDRTSRVDIITSGRSGFGVATSCRLSSIDVRFNGGLVRRYGLVYKQLNESPFQKSLLERIVQYGEDGSTAFNEHSFDYYDDMRDSGNSFIPSVWGNAHQSFIHLILFPWYTSALGSNLGNSGSTYVDVGFSPLYFNQKFISLGGKGGVNFDMNDAVSAIGDVNGDGLADQIYLDSGFIGGAARYRPNLGNGSTMGPGLFGGGIPLFGLGGSLGKEMSMSGNGGPTLNMGVGGFLDMSFGTQTSMSYLTDANGDGLTDFVNMGMVMYNHVQDLDVVYPTPVYSVIPPLYGSAVEFNGDGAADLSDVELGEVPSKETQINSYNYYRDDAIRMWKAPYRGLVRVTGSARLGDYKPPAGEIVQTYTGEDGEPVEIKNVVREYLTDDGARVSIEKGGAVLWSAELGRGNFEPVDPYGVDDIWVEQGDEICFRVNSINDGAYDIVLWDPVIEYQGVDTELHDENGLPVNRYQASEDFNLAGESERSFTVPFNGSVRMTGALRKEAVTSDDITVTINRVDAGGNRYFLYSETVPGNYMGEVNLGMPLDFDVTKEGTSADRIICSLHSDTPINWNSVRWVPQLRYTGTSITYIDGDGATQTLDPEQYKLEYALPVTVRIYPKTDRDPAEPYEVPAGMGGAARVIYQVQRIAGVPVPADYQARVALAVKKDGALVRKETRFISPLDNENIVLDFETNVIAGDRLYFVCASDRSDFTAYALIGTPMIYFESENPRVAGIIQPIIGHEAMGFVYRAREKESAFAGGYRAWYYGRWNGEIDVLNPADMRPLDEQGLDLPNQNDSMDVLRTKVEAINAKTRTFSAMAPNPNPVKDTKNQFIQPPTIAIPDGDRGMWFGNDQDCWISPGKMSATRVGRKYLEEGPPGDEPGKTKLTLATSGLAGFFARAVPKFTTTEHKGRGVSACGVGGDETEGESKTYMDYFDLNGDRFPDIVSKGRVQYTNKNGIMDIMLPVATMGGAVRENSSNNKNLSTSSGGCSSVEAVLTETSLTGGGDVKGHKDNGGNVGFSFSGSAAEGTTETLCDYMDVNGDGLPDRVYKSDTSGPAWVQLNYGYYFGIPKLYPGYDKIRTNTTSSFAMGGTISSDKGGYGGGASVSFTRSAVDQVYIDMNGDGLPDRVFRYFISSPIGLIPYIPVGEMYVSYNTGVGFGPPIPISNSLLEPINYSETMSQSPNGYFTIGIQIWVLWLQIGTVQINMGGGGGRRLGSEKVTLTDINGDGLPDHVRNGANSMDVRLNPTGKTNLLRSVRRPLGGSISITYERRGNTRRMPQSRWVMTGTTVADGMENLDAGAGSAHRYSTSYNYEDGNYNRGEREFYGFARVTETRADGRVLVKDYLNGNFYNKGLEVKNTVRDAGGNLWLVKMSDYDIREVIASRCYAPYLDRTEIRYYEGLTGDENSPEKSTLQTYDYDEYGNVTGFVDYGDASSLDDVRAVISYLYQPGPYIMDRPGLIRVTGAQGEVLRRRVGTYDAKGNLRELR